MPSRRLPWAKNTEIVGVTLKLQSQHDSKLYSQYPIGLHAWWLDQVRQQNPELSAPLHDEQSEKPFTLFDLKGTEPGQPLQLKAEQFYTWTITALSQPVAEWLRQWLLHLPPVLELRGAPLQIIDWTITYPPTTYKKLLSSTSTHSPTVPLSFLSPTSFRHKGHHLPLPLPINVFHSYLRRWNIFSKNPYDQEDFLAWVDECVIISRHHLQSMKVVAGKKGAVTGFTGAIEFELTKAGLAYPDYVQLFSALGQLAPYCGTGHKTTFGLGQTGLGWTEAATAVPISTVQNLLAQRISELTERFIAQRKRIGGDRAIQIAETWATILARRERGESLQAIAEDLGLPYETARTYSKRALRQVRDYDSLG